MGDEYQSQLQPQSTPCSSAFLSVQRRQELIRSPEKREVLCEVLYSYSQEDHWKLLKPPAVRGKADEAHLGMVYTGLYWPR